MAKNSPNTRVFRTKTLIFYLETTKAKVPALLRQVSKLFCSQQPGHWTPVFFEDQVV